MQEHKQFGRRMVCAGQESGPMLFIPVSLISSLSYALHPMRAGGFPCLVVIGQDIKADGRGAGFHPFDQIVVVRGGRRAGIATATAATPRSTGGWRNRDLPDVAAFAPKIDQVQNGAGRGIKMQQHIAQGRGAAVLEVGLELAGSE